MSLDTNVENNLRDMLNELAALRRSKEQDQETIRDLQRRADHAERNLKRVREKCKVLERGETAISPLDEDLLWRLGGGTIELTEKLGGGRRVRIKTRAVRQVVGTNPGQARMLGDAMKVLRARANPE